MTCRPHFWQHPKPGDVALVCGRVLPFEELIHHPFRRKRIVSRRHGKNRGEQFGRALARALKHHFTFKERIA